MPSTPLQHRDDDASEALTQLLAAILPRGIIGGVRRIAEGDEAFAPVLLNGDPMGGVTKVRCTSGAGRRVAAGLLAKFFPTPPAVPRGSGGLPVWPPGFLGSIAHDADYACAILSNDSSFRGMGLDIEPARPLGDDVACMVATPGERRAFEDPSCGLRTLFAIKEAVFKATNPHDRAFLDFPDIQVDRAAQVGANHDGAYGSVASDFFTTNRRGSVVVGGGVVDRDTI